MASQAILKETAPALLPADFDEWDSGRPPATLPEDFNDFDATPPLPAKPATVQAAGSHVESRQLDSTALRAPATAHEHVEEHPWPLQSYSVNPEKGLNRKSKRKMTGTFFAIVSVPLLVLAVLIPLKYHHSLPKTVALNRSAMSQPATTNLTIPALTTPAPELMKPSPAIALEPGTIQEAEQPPAVQSEMMNNQLNAPTRIPRDIKTAGKDTPPSSGPAVAGMEGLGASSAGVTGSIFNGQSGPKVRVESPKIVNISAGVAQGMLIQKTQPVYPIIAKSARVSGTVVLQATISKTGSIQGLHAVSGPEMLRQAAIDAVRTWRYRPYLLNNEPVEVETTVNVIFSWGG
jgi:protein TonB